jgi:hypothetical protein
VRNSSRHAADRRRKRKQDTTTKSGQKQQHEQGKQAQTAATATNKANLAGVALVARRLQLVRRVAADLPPTQRHIGISTRTIQRTAQKREPHGKISKTKLRQNEHA